MFLTIDDRVAIEQLYAEYNFAIDDERPDDFAACFTADGVLDVGYGDPVQGTEALAAFAAATNQMMPGMRHSVTNLILTGHDDGATGKAYLYTYRATADGHQVILTGRYADSLRRVDGLWKFANRKMVPDTPPAQ
jgi:ketosteroid isomerase-like protein